MESWRQLLISWPVLQNIWDSLLICLPIAALMAYTGLFYISTVTKIIAVSKNRSSYNKCAKQIAFIGLILGCALLVGGRIWLYYQRPFMESGSISGFMQEVSWLLLSIGVLMVCIYYFLWGILKNMPILLTTIGMLGAVQNTISLIAILCAMRLFAITASPEAKAFALPDLFPNTWNDPLYSVACYTVPLIFGLAGATSACWLIMRRKNEDYGRDYYNQMVKWCSKWAQIGWGLLWLLLLASSCLQVYQNYLQNLLNMQELIFDSARLLFWIIPFLLFTFVVKARLPLRWRILSWLALIMTAAFGLPYYMELTTI